MSKEILVCQDCNCLPVLESFVIDNNLLIHAVDKEKSPILKCTNDMSYKLTHHATLRCEKCGRKSIIKSQGELVNKDALVAQWNAE